MKRFIKYDDGCGNTDFYLNKAFTMFTAELADNSFQKIRSQARKLLACPADFIMNPDSVKCLKAIQRAIKTNMHPLFDEAISELEHLYKVYCLENKLFFWDDNRKYKPVKGA